MEKNEATGVGLPFFAGSDTVAFLLLTVFAVFSILLFMKHTARWVEIINSSTLAYLYVGFFAFLSFRRKSCAAI